MRLARRPLSAAGDQHLGQRERIRQPVIADRILDGPTVPIGHPARNVELLVVDRWQRVRPLGLPGELLIGGPVLANGYVVEGRTVPFGEHPYRRGERGLRYGGRRGPDAGVWVAVSRPSR